MRFKTVMLYMLVLILLVIYLLLGGIEAQYSYRY